MTKIGLCKKTKFYAMSTAVAVLSIALMLSLSLIPNVMATVGFSDNGVLEERWRFDMRWYDWGYFGSSPAIADLGINNNGTEPDAHLEIATGSDECWGPGPSNGIWRCFDADGNLEWYTGTCTDEARSSLAIADIDGDGDLEMAGGTTSGWFVQVLDHTGGFVWTFPKITQPSVGGPFVWPSSPALCEIDPSVDGLELVIGNRNHGNVWAFDGDNSDGTDEGMTITAADFSGYSYPLGTEGVDWDVLWKVDTGYEVWASPACGDIDSDGTMEVVIGSTNGIVYVIDGPTGTVEHTFATGGPVYASAAIANLDADAYLEMVVGSTDGNIYCFEWTGAVGSTEWTYSTGGAVFSSAAIGDVDLDGDLEIVVGSTDASIYCLSSSGSLEWSYATGGAVYSSPALADRGSVAEYDADWPMFRNNPCRTGLYGATPDTGLDVYVGSDDSYLYLLSGTTGLMIDRFHVYGSYTGGIHTSPSVADVDGDNLLDIFFYDWGDSSIHWGHTFWALEDIECSPPGIPVSVDIKPASWPNPLQLKSKGVLPVAICGTEEFDATTIDPETVQLTLEGLGIGASPLRWSLEDVATPYLADDYGGHDLGADGYLDLTLKFQAQEVIETLGLDACNDGDVVTIILTGNLKAEYDGTAIVGQDYIVILYN